ncbi:MAG: hypothetical protein KGD59_07965 [Candidatus Heimdallarchaeota archaeon]|nr:hypothetical protein [Candidatus Heimdallarchaeota archaeon]MBY8994472.1 hypothetical protein [Candidatus Heimdallarchaeota archaeon]
MSNLTKKYKIGLEYLRKTGFDHIVRELGVFGVEVFKYKPHSRFDSEKKDLPNPCKFRDFVLTKKLMDHYKIKTKVDIARYLRIISIILTNFSLSDEYDNFDIHRRELRRYFQNNNYQSIASKKSAIREALMAYDEAFSSRISIPESDYNDFADVLNLFYNIYESLPKAEMKKEKPITAADDLFDDYNDYDDYEDDDTGTTEYKEPDIMWAYEGLYKDFTDEKLVARLKDDRQRGTLRVSLPTMGIEEHFDTQLKEMLKNESERKKLLQKIQKWHKKTFTK